VYSLGLLTLAALGHGYLWTDLVNRLHAWPGPRKQVDRLTLVCLLAFFSLPPALGVLHYEAEFFGKNISHSTSRWVQGYFFFCALWGGYSLVLNGLRRYATDNRRSLLDWQQENIDTSRQFDTRVLSAGVPRLLAKIPGNQALQLRVDRKRLAIPRLCPNHEGLKIAHISDLHMTGRIGPKWYEFVTEQVNLLEPDVIAITGDIIEKEKCWSWLAHSLGKLQAKQGVYFIFGNHDFYIDTHHTKRLLEDQGLICLSERWAEAQWNGAPVLLAGNERPWAACAADLPTYHTEQLRLMLLHTPDEFAWACGQNANLALAGHTHGGQLRFPLLGPIACPSRYGTRYACGVFRQEETVMHVSRGIAGKTPLRWNCPPEIALLELVRS